MGHGKLRKEVKKQECYPRHPSMQRSHRQTWWVRFQRMALDQLSVLLITYLIKNVHIMAGVRGCSNRITKSIYNQRGKKNTRILKDLDFDKIVRIYFQHIDKRQIVCVYVCVFQLPVGLPLKDGITNKGRTVSPVLPADGCWEYLLYHIMSVAETVLKVIRNW